FNGQLITRHVNLVGIDPETYDNVSQFGRFLLHPGNQPGVSFDLRDGGYAPDREGFPESGWEYRRQRAAYDQLLEQERARIDAAVRHARGALAADTAVEVDEASAGPSMAMDFSSS